MGWSTLCEMKRNKSAWAAVTQQVTSLLYWILLSVAYCHFFLFSSSINWFLLCKRPLFIRYCQVSSVCHFTPFSLYKKKMEFTQYTMKIAKHTAFTWRYVLRIQLMLHNKHNCVLLLMVYLAASNGYQQLFRLWPKLNKRIQKK